MNRSFRRAALPALVAAALGLPAIAGATLGAVESTVQVDGAQMRAAVQVTRSAAYSVHQLSSETGAVREYVSPAGIVYAVAWDGQFMPDLRQVLGAHFDTFVQSPHRVQSGHTHVIVTEPGLVVESIGRLRAFRGRAYLPAAVPPTVSIDSIR